MNGLVWGSPDGSASNVLTRLTRSVSPGRTRRVGPGNGALVDGDGCRLTSERQRHHARREDRVQQTVPAGADLGLNELLRRGGSADVEPGQEHAPARRADGGNPGAGSQGHETPAPDHVAGHAAHDRWHLMASAWMDVAIGPLGCFLSHLVVRPGQALGAACIDAQSGIGLGMTITVPSMPG